MPDYDLASQAIEERMAANFVMPSPIQAGKSTDDLVRYEDVPPKKGSRDAVEWLELYVRHGGSQNISVGNVTVGGGLLTRYAGVIVVHVYTKKNTGTRRRMLICNTAAAVFKNQTFSGIVCREAAVTDADSPNAGSRRSIVRVNFQRDEKT